MADKEVEVELKFPLHNSRSIIEFLNSNAKLKCKDVFQKDSYFVPPHRDFLAIRIPFEWLRLRESEKENSFDYKHFYPEDAEIKDYCDEFQTKLGNIDAMKKILKSLNFKESVVVEKRRSSWIFRNVEISIDFVMNLGEFIELEAMENYEDPNEGKRYLHSILNLINAEVGEENIRGYPFMIIQNIKKENIK